MTIASGVDSELEAEATTIASVEDEIEVTTAVDEEEYESSTSVHPGDEPESATQVTATVCILAGKIYEHGEFIDTGDVCEVCNCLDGEVICALLECIAPADNCTILERSLTQCCPTKYECDGEIMDPLPPFMATTDPPTETTFADTVETRDPDQPSQTTSDEETTISPVDVTERPMGKDETTVESSIESTTKTVIDTVESTDETTPLSESHTEMPLEKETTDTNSGLSGETTTSCMRSNLRYASGAAVPASQCEESCSCTDGEIHCHMKACPPSPPSIRNCTQVNLPGECCPTFNCPTDPNPELSCTHNGRVYADGEDIVSIDICTACFCISGEIICATLECEAPAPRCTPASTPVSACCPDVYDCVGEDESDSTTTPSLVDGFEDGTDTTVPVEGEVEVAATTTIHPETEIEVGTDTTGPAEGEIENAASSTILPETELEIDVTTPSSETQDDAPVTNLPFIDGGCLKDGVVYANGGIVPAPTECIEKCICSDGEIMCITPTCPNRPPETLHCQETLVPGQCCPTYVCDNEEPGCVVDGTFYNHGERVNSSDICQECFCISGDHVCATLECEAPKPRCVPVRTDTRSCCPLAYMCPEEVDVTTTTSTTVDDATDLVTEAPADETTEKTPEDGATEQVAETDVSESVSEVTDEAVTEDATATPNEIEVTTVQGSDDTASEVTESSVDVTGDLTRETADATVAPETDDSDSPVSPEVDTEVITNEVDESEGATPTPEMGSRICELNGTTYSDDESMPIQDPCQLSCKCANGTVKCEREACRAAPPQFFRCAPVPVYEDGQCCPIYTCPNTPEPVDENKCTRGNETYQDGDFVPSGSICTDCHCISGEIVCADVECIAPVDNCEPVFQATGDCCPSLYECQETTPDIPAVTFSQPDDAQTPTDFETSDVISTRITGPNTPDADNLVKETTYALDEESKTTSSDQTPGDTTDKITTGNTDAHMETTTTIEASKGDGELTTVEETEKQTVTTTPKVTESEEVSVTEPTIDITEEKEVTVDDDSTRSTTDNDIPIRETTTPQKGTSSNATSDSIEDKTTVAPLSTDTVTEIDNETINVDAQTTPAPTVKETVTADAEAIAEPEQEHTVIEEVDTKTTVDENQTAVEESHVTHDSDKTDDDATASPSTSEPSTTASSTTSDSTTTTSTTSSSATPPPYLYQTPGVSNITGYTSPSPFPPFPESQTTPWAPTSTSDFVLGPGACMFDGKVYVSAQQILRDDPCDFCFCFRGDIICLQQSCPPPVPGCYEEPIAGFCCPRYECPVTQTLVNVTTTTTPIPTYPPVQIEEEVIMCEINDKYYRLGERVEDASGPCMECLCGSNGMLECNPKNCPASPMLDKLFSEESSSRKGGNPNRKGSGPSSRKGGFLT